MYTYEKLYHDLFNAITDAIGELEQNHPYMAKQLLITAQQTSEDHFIEAEEMKK